MRPARDGMVPLAVARSVPADLGLDDALELLGGEEGMVLEDGRLVGSIAPADIERWYQSRLGGAPPAPASAVPPRPDL
jgi:hypothetical protein